MTSIRSRLLLLAVALCLCASACGGSGGRSGSDPSSGTSGSPKEARRTMLEVMRGVGSTLSAPGARVTEASGRFAACGSAPTTAVEYRATGKLAQDGPTIGKRIDAAVAALRKDGWEVRSSTAEGGAKPFANLEKDGLRLSLRPDVLRGSEAMTYTLSGACIRVRDEDAAGYYEVRDTIAP